MSKKKRNKRKASVDNILLSVIVGTLDVSACILMFEGLEFFGHGQSDTEVCVKLVLAVIVVTLININVIPLDKIMN